jgi:dihydroorotate dehydrogenase electron transfer subunit
MNPPTLSSPATDRAQQPVFRPAGPFGGLPYPATVREVRVENYRIRTFVLDALIPQAQPGQFVMAWLPGLEEAPFSLAYHTPVTVTVARVGPFTEALHRLAAGDRLWLRGPYGQPFRAEAGVRRPLLVGGGYGAAPLAFLAESLLADGQRPVVLIGGRTAADIIGLERFRQLGVPSVVTTEDGSLGEAGLVTTPVERMMRSGEGEALYGVGPHGMLQALESLARAYRLPAQLSWEATIGCSLGLCGKCEHTDGSLLCVEGPVRSVIH